MRYLLTTALLLVLAGVVSEAPAQEIAPARPLWHSLQPGPNPIGFRMLNILDSLRGGPRPRAVRLAVWYPAAAGSTRVSMVFGDYLEASPSQVPDVEFERWMNRQDVASLGRQFFDADSTAQQAALMGAHIPVIEGAPAADGRFPLVLHSLGRNANQFQHTILWEYLASHGFVVASVAQFGRDLKEPWMAFSFEDLRIQFEDMRSAFKSLAQHPSVDPTRIAAMGHSSGAIIALWLAATEPRIAAVVGLDGSVNREEGRDIFQRGLDDRRVVPPFLNICRWPHDEYDDGFESRLTGEVVRIGYERAIHFDFQNWPAYQAFADATEPRSMAVRSVEEARRVFESTAVFARLFLEATLEADSTARAILMDPARVSAISSGLASVRMRQRQPEP